MNEITSSYIVANGISKTPEFIAAFLLVLSGLLVGIKFPNIVSRLEKFINIDDGLFIILAPFFMALVLMANINQTQSVGIFTVLLLTYIFFKKYTFEVNVSLYKTLIIIALFYKLITESGSIAYLGIVGLLVIYSFYKFTPKSFCLFWIACLIQNFQSNDFIISELFHPAEYLTTYIAEFSKEAHYSNLGFIEEFIPYIANKFFYFGTFENFSLSLVSVRSVIKLGIIFIVYSVLIKRYQVITIFFICAFFPSERISLLICLLYVVLLNDFIHDGRKNFIFALLLALPLLFLGHFSYAIIPILYVTYIFLFEKYKLSLKALAIILSIWLFFAALNLNQINLFVSNFLGMTSNYVDAHGFPFSYGNSYNLPINLVILYKYLIVFLVGLSLSLFLNLKSFVKFTISFGVICVVLYVYVNYAFVRIDLNSPSRLLPISIALVAICTLINEKYKGLLFFIVISSLVLYPLNINFSKFNLGKIHLDAKQELYRFAPSPKEYAEKISTFFGKEGGILLSDKPSLNILIKNSLSPYFMSPWLAHTQYVQNSIISFLGAHPNLPIFLGYADSYSARNSPFFTFDAVDIRSRSPLLYKYLAHNYQSLEMDNVLYAIPKSGQDHKNTILFSGFDLGYAAKYYENKKIDAKNIRIDCKDDSYQKYKITNSLNFFYVNLKCGSNQVPAIYFDGDFLRYELEVQPIKPKINIDVLKDW